MRIEKCYISSLHFTFYNFGFVYDIQFLLKTKDCSGKIVKTNNC